MLFALATISISPDSSGRVFSSKNDAKVCLSPRRRSSMVRRTSGLCSPETPKMGRLKYVQHHVIRRVVATQRGSVETAEGARKEKTLGGTEYRHKGAPFLGLKTSGTRKTKDIHPLVVYHFRHRLVSAEPSRLSGSQFERRDFPFHYTIYIICLKISSLSLRTYLCNCDWLVGVGLKLARRNSKGLSE